MDKKYEELLKKIKKLEKRNSLSYFEKELLELIKEKLIKLALLNKEFNKIFSCRAGEINKSL